jgi:NRAMP (natural resistance-associated macrophage protein)-like metal ion transporter
MNNTAEPEGLEPLDALQSKVLPIAPRAIASGLRMTIRGRGVTLRGLRRKPTGIWRWLVILGPGLIATSAGNDAGGIATYTQAGAKFGYELIWVMVLLTLSFALVQEMCARLGAATGRGLLDLIRERFGIAWALFAVFTILIANAAVTVSEFVGIGAAMELLGVSKYIAVPLGALLIWGMVIFGSYAKVEKLLLLMTLVFFAYPVAAILAKPNWADVARGAFIPTLKADRAYIFLMVGLLGTTITPYIQVFQQSSLVEKGVARRHYGPERVDAYIGAVFSNLMSISMIVATAATLFVAGQHEIGSAADAARALEPVVGSAARVLFGIGLLGATLLAGAVLPLATAYAISEAFGAPKGVNLDFRRGKVFFGFFTALIVVGVAFALIPGIPVMQLLIGVQVLNGVLLPIVLIFILLLINDKHLMLELKNTRRNNVLAIATLVLITGAVLVMLGGQVLGWLGY